MAAPRSETVVRLETLRDRFWPGTDGRDGENNNRFRCAADFGFVFNKRPFEEHHFNDGI